MKNNPMKTVAFLIFVIFFHLSANAQQAAVPIKITGDISGIANGTKIWLLNFEEPADTIASAIVQEGNFTFDGFIEEADLYRIYFTEQAEARIFLNAETLHITGNISHPADFLYSGSSTQTNYLAFDSIFTPYYNQLNELVQQLKTARIQNQNDPLMQEYLQLINETKKAISQFVGDRKNSPVSAFSLLVTSTIEEDPFALERNFNLLTDEVKNSLYGKILGEKVADNLIGQIGTKAISFQQEDTVGKMINFEEFKGRYVLIDFWASWCKPCRIENPNVVNAFNKFKNKNFTVLGISLDRSKEDWLDAIAEDNLTWTQLSDLQFWNNEVSKKYKISSIPQNLLVDPNGIIIAKNLRGPVLQAKLCEILGCD